MQWNEKKIGFVFAGQGAQHIGMAKDFYETSNNTKALFERASKILGYSLEDICFTENEQLHQTKYTQPAIFVATVAMFEEFLLHASVKPLAMCGFSLGEFAAIYASKMLSFEDTLALVSNRATWMEEAALKNPGGMVAVIGVSREVVEEVARDIPDVMVANYNAPSQTVVSGLITALVLFEEKIKERGARRVVRLQVSGAFHTPLMNEAAFRLQDFAKTLDVQKPNGDTLANATVKPYQKDTFSKTIYEQMISPVYFEHAIGKMKEEYQIDTIIEFGPGTVLSGLIRKIAPDIEVHSIHSIATMKQVLGE